MKNTVSDLKKYMGGDDGNVPISLRAINDMERIVAACQGKGLQKPDLFPWAGGNGAQAEWELPNGWYVEIDSASNRLEMLLIKDRKSEGYGEKIECSFNCIDDAIRLAEAFMKMPS